MEEQTIRQGEGEQQCIFCHIAAGSIESKKIYEDDKTVAVLDINPASPGHILLIPKKHYAVMPQIPETEIDHIAKVAKAISHALLKALKVQGTNIFIANGAAAGQRAPHFMIHIIPRKEDDGLYFELPEHKMKEKDAELLKKAFKGEKIEAEKQEEADAEKHEAGKKPKKRRAKNSGNKKKDSEKPNLDEITRMVTG